MPPGRPAINAVIGDSFSENEPILGPSIKIHAMAWPESTGNRRGDADPAKLKPKVRRDPP